MKTYLTALAAFWLGVLLGMLYEDGTGEVLFIPRVITLIIGAILIILGIASLV
jgi:hypothetical protein